MKLKLLAGLLFIACCLLFPASVGAQFQSSNYLNTNPDVPNNLHTYSQSVLIEITSAVSCIISGVDPANPGGKCLGIDPNTKKLGYVESGTGLIGITGDLIAGTFYLPVNSGSYIQNVAANFGIAKKANAQQGIGFNGLQPTLKLWQAFRNITYMLFVILFVVVGLGIMFRIKIDPRTVMTLQNQIPKIIIAIVLVTFSYAIAGFLVDLMYILLYLSVSIFAQQGVDPANIAASDPFAAVGGFGNTVPLLGGGSGGISGIAGGAASSVGKIISSMLDGTIGNIIGAIIGGLIGKLIAGSTVGNIPGIGGIIGNIAGTGIGAGLGFLFGSKIVGLFANIVAYVIIMIAILTALLKLWFVLIKSYIYILITVVFAPFYMAYGLIPGKSGFGNWMKSMVANLAVYPVTIIMILLAKAFMEGFTKATPGNPPFIPPMVGDWARPDRFGPIIGLAFILMLPEVANIVRDALKAPDLKYSAAIGKGLSTGAGAIGAPISTIGSKIWGVDPYTKEPKWLTKQVINKVGRGSGLISKGIRAITGTGKWYTRETREGRTEENRRQHVEERSRRLGGNTGIRNRLDQLRQLRAARNTPPGGLRGGQGPQRREPGEENPPPNTGDGPDNPTEGGGPQPGTPPNQIPPSGTAQTPPVNSDEQTGGNTPDQQVPHAQPQQPAGGSENPRDKNPEELQRSIDELRRSIDQLRGEEQAIARRNLADHEEEQRRRNLT